MFGFGVGNSFAKSKFSVEKRGWKQYNNLEPLNRLLLCIFISFGVRWSWFYINNCAVGTYTKLSPIEKCMEYEHFLLQVLHFHRTDVSDEEIRLGTLTRLALINPLSWNKFLAWKERNYISSRWSVTCVDNALPVHQRIRWVLKLFWGSSEVAIFGYNSCLLYPSLVIREQQM